MKTTTLILLLWFSYSLSAQNTILWEITDSTSNTTSYLLGTQHTIGAHFLDTFPVIEDKMLECELAIFEAIATGNNHPYILEREDNFKYRKVLSSSEAKSLEEIAKNWNYPPSKQSPSTTFLKLHKEVIIRHCGNYLPGQKIIQFDDLLEQIALQNGLQVFGLENDSIQFDIINEFNNQASWKEMKKMIKSAIAMVLDPKGGEKYCVGNDDYWKVTFDYALTEPCEPSIIMSGRNDSWMEQLPALLEEKPCFIAVGLYHLFHECGLISQLRKQGFTIKPVQMR